MELKIYSQQGVLKATVSPSDSDRHVKEVMNDNVLNLSFTLYGYVELVVNDYVDFGGERFTLLEDYKPEQKSTVEYAYSCKFYGIESELKKAKVLKLVDNENELSFSYDATAAEHLQLVCDNINRIKGTRDWVIGEVVSSSNVNIEYDNIFCFDALSEIARQFNTEWWIEGTTINLSRCEHGTPVSLGYGKGLLGLSRVENDTVPFFTRLYPLGSTRNIVASDYGHRRLQLPGGVRYVERNTHLGIVEQAEEDAFAHIFPKRVGRVSTVRTEEAKGEDGNAFTIYYFTDEGLDFDPNTYEIGGLVKQVSFQGGELDGRDFEVNYDSGTREFEIITQFPYENQQLPGGLLVPKPGDEYILWNIRMPEEYYPLAEKEFGEAVRKYMETISVDTSVYKAPTDYIYLDENRIDLKPGRRVLLENEIYFPTGTHESRVTRISRRVNNPTDMDIECTYAVDYGRINRIESDIVDIQAAYKEQLNKDVLTVLKSWDSIDPSEYNVFSALRSMKEFLSKNRTDEAKAYINFMRGLGVCDKLLGDILRVGDKGEAGNQSVYSSLRTDKEIEAAIEGLGDKYLRKDMEDTARELIHFLKGIDVKGAATFHDSINSPDFLSGFLNGKGWAIMLREVLNAAGESEKKSYAEVDDLTVRGAMRVFELIINQLKGEGDNSVFSGMMKVDHADTENKKIYLDTGGGLLYNPFRADDCIACQRYGGKPTEENDHYITKQYELVVTGAGMGADSEGEKRLDWVTYDNFTGKESDIKKGDILVRMDNLTDPDRKGIIMNMTVGPFTPYIDVLYGAKTDPANAVRSRFGNLAGAYSAWFGWMRGFGAFIENLYAIGEYHFRNGESIQTRLDMMENLFRVDMQKKSYDASEADNHLKNATFTENMEGWKRENTVRMFTAGGKPIMFNRNLFVEKEKIAGIVNLDGRNVLRLKNSGIRQMNADVRKPDPAGSVLYLSFRYTCKSGGTLTAGFEGAAQEEGSLPFVEEEIEESKETQELTRKGTWDGRGDFVLSFTGDIYIEVLALSSRPLDDYKIEVATKFEQTAEQITLLGERIDNTDRTVTGLGIELDAANENIRLWGEKTDKINSTVTQIGIDLDMAEEKLDLYVRKTDDINSTVSDLGLRMAAAEGELELFSKFEDKANGLFTSLGTRMNSAEGTLETYATRLNSLDGTTISLGNRISAAEGTLETYVTKTNAIDGSLTSLGTRMNAVEKRFTNYVLTDTFNGTVGDINVTLNRHWSAIEQTDKNLLLSINKSTGYPLNKDVKFVKGMNGISRYDNSGGGSVAVRRIVIYRGASVPSTSNPPAGGWTTDDVRAAHVDDVYYDSSTGTWYTYAVSGTSYAWREGTPEFGTVPAGQAAVIRIQKVVGNSSPYLGGFTFSTPSRANAVFEARFTANVPKGYRLSFASNAIGNNGRGQWITDNAGTGDWKEYRYQVFCGASGSFSTTNFFCLKKDVPEGQANDDHDTAVTWYLLEATVFDLSGYEDPVSYINLTEGLAKIKAARIELEGLVTVNGNFKVLQDGSIEATNGKFTGEINATKGKIGGFEIGSGRIGSVATSHGSGGGLAIYDNLIRVGGEDGYAMFGEDVIPSAAGGAFTATGRIVNRHPNVYGSYGFDQANYGLFIDVAGGTKNYGISSNAALMAPSFINTRAKLLNFSGGSYSVDFSQHTIILMYYNRSGYSGTEVTLPPESSVARQFGLSSLPSDFAATVTFRVRPGSLPITLKGIYNHNEDLTDYRMDDGDSVTLLISKADGFRYQILNHSY